VSLFGLGARRLRLRMLISKGGQIVGVISRALFLGRDGERQSSDIDADPKYRVGIHSRASSPFNDVRL